MKNTNEMGLHFWGNCWIDWKTIKILWNGDNWRTLVRCGFLKICLFVLWQTSLDTLQKKNLALELELVKAQKDGSDSVEKLREIELMCSQLQQNVKRFFFI